jgi:hypothetical protein
MGEGSGEGCSVVVGEVMEMEAVGVWDGEGNISRGENSGVGERNGARVVRGSVYEGRRSELASQEELSRRMLLPIAES